MWTQDSDGWRQKRKYETYPDDDQLLVHEFRVVIQSEWQEKEYNRCEIDQQRLYVVPVCKSQ